MSLKKGEFFITAKSKNGKGLVRKPVKGYINEDISIGYDHRRSDELFATYIESGYKVASGWTLKGCQMNVSDIIEKIRKFREMVDYKEQIEKIKNYPIERQ